MLDHNLNLIHGDCIEAMNVMQPESVDAVCTDPPYGLEFMGKGWDAPWRQGQRGDEAGFAEVQLADGATRLPSPSYTGSPNLSCLNCGGSQRGQSEKGRKRCRCDRPSFLHVAAMQGRRMQEWHQAWAEAAYRVAKPSAYLLAFGGTRTVHRLTTAIEDAGWIIRDMLVWAYASGFPKSKASLKPAWEPIVMARKPGPLRMLAIDECRIPTGEDQSRPPSLVRETPAGMGIGVFMGGNGSPLGRWPSNVILTDPIFDGGLEGVVGGGTVDGQVGMRARTPVGFTVGPHEPGQEFDHGVKDSGTYSRFFLIPKADRAEREPIAHAHEWWGGSHGQFDPPQCLVCGTAKGNRANVHPTVKPVDLMRHLVRLVTPTGGIVLDPFAGSGSTLIAAEMEGFEWIGIEKEAEYVAIAEARLNGTQRGLGLPA